MNHPPQPNTTRRSQEAASAAHLPNWRPPDAMVNAIRNMADCAIVLSVTVVTFNHGVWLKQCVDSILSQVVDFPYEILIGDDCSTDPVSIAVGRGIAKDHPENVRYFRHEKNLGPDGNLFGLLKQTRGQYIAHLDGDDLMLPGKLQAQVAFLNANPTVAMVGHHMLKLHSSRLTRSPAVVKGRIGLSELLLTGCPFSNSAKMYRRSAIRVWQRAAFTVDFFLHVDHALSGDIVVLPRYFGIYRDGVGISSRPDYMKKIAHSYMDAIDHAEPYIADKSFIVYARYRMRVMMAVEFLRKKMYSDSARWLRNIPDQELSLVSWKHRLLRSLACFPNASRLAVGIHAKIIERLKVPSNRQAARSRSR